MMPSPQNSVHRQLTSDFIAQRIERLRGASSLGQLTHIYRSAIIDFSRIFGPRIGPSERPEEQELREVFRAIYQKIVRERRREYQRNYMRRWRAANPEKAKAQNRKAARTYREFKEIQKVVDEYYSNLNSLTQTLASS